jgi:hypothetical protein
VLDDQIPEERTRGIEAGLAWGELAVATVVYADRGITPGMKLGIGRAINAGRAVETRLLDTDMRGEPRPLPSQVSQRRYATPFVASFGKFERELAAALYVEACVNRGNEWQPLGPRCFAGTVEVLLDEDPSTRIPWIGFGAAAHVVPDVRGLVIGGWLSMASDKTVQPTDAFFSAIAPYVMPTAAAETEGEA